VGSDRKDKLLMSNPSKRSLYPEKVFNQIKSNQKKTKFENEGLEQNTANMSLSNADEKKANFSALNPTNGAIVKLNQSSAKGEIKKIVIKNFKSKFQQK
jgi:hypothetical protein